MTSENKYQVLDDAICAHIRADRGHPTNSSRLEDIARPLSPSQPWRLIERRMLAMRKDGRLEYGKPLVKHGSRWRVVAQPN
ncbi:MAG: hypothetical protein RLZZ373_2629 [Pseudomonadota bacterium]|jgi:hypothetical protein